MEKAENLYKDKKILILGLGLNQGGVGAAKFFAGAGAKVKVTDLKTKEELQKSLDQLRDLPNIEYTLGEHKYEDLDWADFIIRNPALLPNNKYLQYALQKGKQVEMDMGIFLRFKSPNQVIGITGTKGKSTTASLIYEILQAAGKKVVFAGNIQKSILEALPEITEDTLVVLELSSFQLQAFAQHKISPHWSVITNIYPDHLNYHGNMEDYITAKRAIVQYQRDNLQGHALRDEAFLNRHDRILKGKEFAKGLPGKITYFGPEDLPQNFTPLLPGKHNLANMAAALAVTKSLGIEEKLALRVMQNFQGVEYRLQMVKVINGVKIYNDTAATTPQATIEALQALPNSILICGGMNKGLDYSEMADAVTKYTKDVYFIEGDATEEIKSKIASSTASPRNDVIANVVKQSKTYNDLNLLLKNVLAEAKPGDVILFSPGATSFNLFQNEFDRGEKFNQALQKLTTQDVLHR